MGMNDVHSLSHSKWNCKYHIVFAPKYRRKVFYQGCESIVETEKKMTKGARREIVRCEQTDRTLLRDLSSQSG